MQEIARIELAPDADMSFLDSLRVTIRDYIKGTNSAAAQSPSSIPGQSPVPVMEGEMSRGPQPGMEMGPMTEELAAAMQGVPGA